MELEEEIPIPIPIPITSTFVGGHGHANSPPLHHFSNGPPTLSTPAAEDHHLHLHGTNSKKGQAVKYRECLKNHAASIGGTATDGCGEFMPSGEEGSLEALKCSACGCHRNFHRKEIEGESPPATCDCYGAHLPFKSAGRKQQHHHHLAGHRGGLLLPGSAADAFGYSPVSNSLVPRPPPQLIMPLGALQTSESDEMEGVGGGGGGFMARLPFAKKRFRTKFTAEQKEKMLQFAEKIGWRLQKQEEDVVQQFCQEICVKRRVLKVWMHNNKHNLAKKSSSLQLE